MQTLMPTQSVEIIYYLTSRPIVVSIDIWLDFSHLRACMELNYGIKLIRGNMTGETKCVLLLFPVPNHAQIQSIPDRTFQLNEKSAWD